MQKLEIIRGEEFKIAVKDKIDVNDIFIEEYRRAAIMLDEITGSSLRMADQQKSGRKWTWKQQDFENNIIAFCGNRGEGKSSAMMTFVNALYGTEYKRDGIFSKCQNLDKVHFAEPILIDPSMFDDVHNVLDIVLAKIFRKFSERYERDNQYADEVTRDRLVNQFQKVYRHVSLINNQKQMMDDEFDYEGNISKLSKLGESTNLKRELSELIEMYLRFVDGQNGNSQMIIAIDDLDLCSSNAYKMAEQIRKYLIIPNIAIVISVKIDQLELCVREQNLRDFEKIYQNKDEGVYSQLNREVQTMAERYVAKLIPGQRRIYLAKIQNLDEAHIVYKEQDGETIIWDSREARETSKGAGFFVQAMIDLIYERTGMRFLPEENGSSYLFPNNLRDIISWITMIVKLNKVDRVNDTEKDKVYLENILIFKEYFEKEWSGDNLMLYDGSTLEDIGNMDIYHMHIVVCKILENICSRIELLRNPELILYDADSRDSFFRVMGLFEIGGNITVDPKLEAYIYRLRALYTMKMNSILRNHDNQLNGGMADFIKGYIWGPWFKGVLPMEQESRLDRSRFVMETIGGFNCILERVNKETDKLTIPEYGKSYYISYITDGRGREDYIKAWILLALFSNISYVRNNRQVFSSDGAMISGNSRVCEYVQISLENYLVGLSNLDVLCDKINIDYLGIKEEEYKKIIEELKRDNRNSIRCTREIISNVDIALGLKAYCTKYKDYRKATKNAVERSRRLVETFFINVQRYMAQCGIECDSEEFLNFSVGEVKIDVGELYADLFELSVQNEPLRRQLEEEREIDQSVLEFRRKITEIPKDWNPENYVEYHVSSSLRNFSAENMKINLDNFASSISQYIGAYKKLPQGLDVDGSCSLYGEVMKIYRRNKKGLISKEQHEEYKRLVRVQKDIEAAF